jgi:DNA-binding NtrC family response regulator
MTRPSILLADDEDTLREHLAQVLIDEGFEVIACRDGTEALRTLEKQAVDAIVTDLRMPGVSGMELIDHATQLAAETPIIVITAFGDVNTAIEAMKRGAQDYLCKPLMFDELILKLRQVLGHSDLVRENRALRDQIHRDCDFSGIVAESPAMRETLDVVKRVAHTRSNVLLLGESGTGKEALARTLHYNGITRDKAFVAVNCGGLTASLIESELFGHRKGTFTGASADRIGYFEAAHGGTLFLDEIGSLPVASQPILLRAIEEKAIIRVGDTRSIKVDIRIIAATNGDIEEAIAAGEFREDLYYRLNIIRINLPALRERTEDIPPLIRHFVDKYNRELNASCPGFCSEATLAMCGHPWRGNVRELENVVERALIFAPDRAVEIRDLPPDLRGEGGDSPDALDLRRAMRDYERNHISQVLAYTGGDKSEAANILGIGLSSLYRKLDDMQIRLKTRSGDGRESGAGRVEERG